MHPDLIPCLPINCANTWLGQIYRNTSSKAYKAVGIDGFIPQPPLNRFLLFIPIQDAQSNSKGWWYWTKKCLIGYLMRRNQWWIISYLVQSYQSLPAKITPPSQHTTPSVAKFHVKLVQSRDKLFVIALDLPHFHIKEWQLVWWLMLLILAPTLVAWRTDVSLTISVFYIPTTVPAMRQTNLVGWHITGRSYITLSFVSTAPWYWNIMLAHSNYYFYCWVYLPTVVINWAAQS